MNDMTIKDLLILANLSNSDEDNLEYDGGQFHLLSSNGEKIYPDQAQERLREITKTLVEMGYNN